MIKSFRGKLASGSSDVIRLSTNNGLTGYKIKKVETISTDPGAYDEENIFKLFSVEELDATGVPVINGQLDFNSPTLLGAVFFQTGTAATKTASTVIVFDNVVINQDLHITAIDVGGSTRAINYYIELEQVKLDINEATVATLKDMRGRE